MVVASASVATALKATPPSPKLPASRRPSVTSLVGHGRSGRDVLLGSKGHGVDDTCPAVLMSDPLGGTHQSNSLFQLRFAGPGARAQHCINARINCARTNNQFSAKPGFLASVDDRFAAPSSARCTFRSTARNEGRRAISACSCCGEVGIRHRRVATISHGGG